MARAQGGAVSHIYTTAIKGFAAKMPALSTAATKPTMWRRKSRPWGARRAA
jgi:3-oxoacyl-(acyl-carrier-protein) synthase